MFPTPASVRWSRIAAFTGARRLASRAASSFAVNAGSSGSGPTRAARYGVELARLEQEPRSEAPDVAIGDVRSVV